MFENVDGRTTDARVTGILIAHLGAFGSGGILWHFDKCRRIQAFAASF